MFSRFQVFVERWHTFQIQCPQLELLVLEVKYLGLKATKLVQDILGGVIDLNSTPMIRL